MRPNSRSISSNAAKTAARSATSTRMVEIMPLSAFCGLHARYIDIADDDASASPCRGARQRPPDTARTTGYDDDIAVGFKTRPHCSVRPDRYCWPIRNDLAGINTMQQAEEIEGALGKEAARTLADCRGRLRYNPPQAGLAQR